MIPKIIIIHHSFTKDQKTVDWDAIRRYHTSWRYQGTILSKEEAVHLLNEGTKGIEAPWADIGYHFGIERVSGLLTRQTGRPTNLPGFHCRGINSYSLGICFVGNYDLAPPDDEMLIFGATLISELLNQFSIIRNDVYSHHYFATYKTCPGSMFPMAKLKSLLT